MAEQDATPEPPAEGTIWRERRRQYARRTVRVLWAMNGFVTIDTVTTDFGRPPKQAVRTRVRLDRWHKTFEEVETR